MAEKMKLTIKPFGFMDLLNFKNLVPDRKKRFASASTAPLDAAPPMNLLAGRLHPVRQYLAVEEVREEAPGVKTFRLVPDKSRGTSELAYFRAGQYLSLKIDIDGVTVTRPYSISSAPHESLSGYYTITVKKQESGFVTDHIFDTWKKGTPVVSSGPEGHFYYEELRDMDRIVGIAGGCGITPFMSMARQFSREGFPVDFVLLYGCNTMSEVIFRDELKEIERKSGGRFRVVFVVCNEKPSEPCETGFITAAVMKKYTDPVDSSFFICGPQKMYDFVKKEIDGFALPVKQVRRELFGEIKTIRDHRDYPKGVKESFSLEVSMAGKSRIIPALAGESLLVALERAGLKPPSKCRSGVCSFCRCELRSGKVFIPEDTDGRRGADKKHGFIHACASYPLSDLSITVQKDEV